MRQDQLKFFNLEWCSTPAQLPKVLPHFTLKMAEIGQLWRLTAIEPVMILTCSQRLWLDIYLISISKKFQASTPTNFSGRRLFVRPNFKGKQPFGASFQPSSPYKTIVESLDMVSGMWGDTILPSTYKGWTEIRANIVIIDFQSMLQSKYSNTRLSQPSCPR